MFYRPNSLYVLEDEHGKLKCNILLDWFQSLHCLTVCWNIVAHTFWPPCVDLLHGVIQADADWSEAHLSLQPCHQATVQTPRALGLHHGEDGAKHTSVFCPLAVQWGLGFTLNLEQHATKFVNSLRGQWWCYETEVAQQSAGRKKKMPLGFSMCLYAYFQVLHPWFDM